MECLLYVWTLELFSVPVVPVFSFPVPLPHVYLKPAPGLEKENANSCHETNSVKEGAVLTECGYFCKAHSTVAELLLDTGQLSQAILA